MRTYYRVLVIDKSTNKTVDSGPLSKPIAERLYNEFVRSIMINKDIVLERYNTTSPSILSGAVQPTDVTILRRYDR